MKIYLLDRNYNMVREWKKVFDGISNVECVRDEFDHFMDTHNVECIVSPANSFGIMDGGYDLAISHWFGWELMDKVQEYIYEHYHGEQPVGTSFLIDTGKNNIKLIHTPTMREPEAIKEPLVVYVCMRSTLLCAMEHGVENIVIPAFGGCSGFVNHSVVAELMVKAYKQVFSPVNKHNTWNNINRM